MDKLNEIDPVLEKLKSVTDDKAIEGYEQNYVVKPIGSIQQFNQVGSAEGSAQSYHIVLLKSNVWPGFSTVVKNGAYSSIYVGYAMKNIK